MARVLRSIDGAFDKAIGLTGGLAVGLMLLLAVLVFLVTVSRYVFRINLPGLFDGSVYALIVFPFLTAAYAMRQGRHISVDVLTSRLSPRTQAVLNVAVYLAAALFVIVLGAHGIRWMASLFKYGTHTDAAYPIPKGILAGVIVFGSLLLILQMARVIVNNIRTVVRETSSPGLPDNPWLCASLFIGGIVLSVLLFVYGNAAAGITLLALVILFSGMPVFLALGLIGVLGLYFLLGPDSWSQVPPKAFSAMNSFTLTALPLFVLGGLIMEESGIAEDMFRLFELWTGRWAASPLVVTIVLGMAFCAISGSSAATTAVVAAVTLPVLVRRGFNKGLSCGLVAGTTVGTLIPPSIGYVVYGVITGESVGKLFMATLVPAVVLFALYFAYIIFLGIFRKKSLFEGGQAPQDISVRQVTWKDRLLGFRTAVWGLLTPVIIIGGIYFGIYTPTESAAVLVVYAVIVGVFIKKVSWRSILRGTLKSAEISAMILCIIVTAYIFALVISQLQVSSSLVAYAQATGMTSLQVIGLLFIVLIILGLFLESASIKVITLPIFYPLAMAVGINSLWLGVFYQFLSEIGLLTPPVGINVFIIKGVTGISLDTVIKGTVPFLLMMVLTVVLLYFFPQMVTWLPATMR